VVGVTPALAAVTAAAGTIYVAGTGDGTLTIIDPTDNSTSQLTGFTRPSVLLAARTGTPAAGTLYLVDGAAIRILDAHGQPIRTITDDHSPVDLAVAPAGTPLAQLLPRAERERLAAAGATWLDTQSPPKTETPTCR
jgi:DNA-binding beta-propeller fold protein YncE